MVTIMSIDASKTFPLIACLAVVLAAGCASGWQSTSKDVQEQPTSIANLLRDRETALALLRAEIASARIEAAKKEAELIELRELVLHLRKENAESRQTILDQRQTAEVADTELKQVRSERDQLKVAHNEPATLRQETPALRETLLMLSKEVEQLKKERQSPASPVQKSVARTEHQPTDHSITPTALMVRPNLPATATEDQHVVVQRGDTLMGLARRFRTTLGAIVDANALQSERLEVGQTLSIPQPHRSNPLNQR
jgi:LysM repeat protein